MNGNLNIGTINGLTIDQILDKMASKGIGIHNPNGIFIQDYSDIIDGKIALGSVVKMGNYNWLVCHFNPEEICLWKYQMFRKSERTSISIISR